MNARLPRPMSLGAILASAVLLAGCEVTPGTAAAGTTPTLQRATPEEVGMSSERLTRLREGMQRLVDDGLLAGMTTMIARRGRIVDFQTYGHRDAEAQDPISEDAIFRIYSMSKPITGVALMTLYEEGKFRLSTPSSATYRSSRISRSCSRGSRGAGARGRGSCDDHSRADVAHGRTRLRDRGAGPGGPPRAACSPVIRRWGT